MASTIMPRAPLPLRGFMSAVGRAVTQSDGRPLCRTSHAMPSTSQSMAPEARNTPTPTRMATR